MKTMLEILDEPAAAYTSETRALDDEGACQYFANGRMCAVGRCMTDPKSFFDAGDVDDLAENHDFNEVLKPEYRGFTIEFWSVLQWLHDKSANWDSLGLSPHGAEDVISIKKQFNLGECHDQPA